MAFTGLRDTDLIILGLLDDKSLFNVCLTNKYVAQLCGNESFWMNRYRNRFNSEFEDEKPPNISWKNYYLKKVYTISDTNVKDYELFYMISPSWKNGQSISDVTYSLHGIDSGNIYEIPSEFRDNILYKNIEEITIVDDSLINFEKTYNNTTYIDIVKDLIKVLEPYKNLDMLGFDKENYDLFYMRLRDNEEENDEEEEDEE